MTASSGRGYGRVLSRRTALVIVAAVAILALAGIATGAIPGSDGRVQACYAKVNGQLRVVDKPSDCRSNEVPLGWAQRGPQGVAGETGPSGPAGPQGERGPAGPAPSSNTRTYAGRETISAGCCGSSRPLVLEVPGRIRLELIDCVASTQDPHNAMQGRLQVRNVSDEAVFVDLMRGGSSAALYRLQPGQHDSPFYGRTTGQFKYAIDTGHEVIVLTVAPHVGTGSPFGSPKPDEDSCTVFAHATVTETD